MASPSPCNIVTDKDELIVDCQVRSLTQVSSSWFPENTTSILLDNNMLTSVPVNLYLLHRLRRLSLSYNQIEELDVDTFRGLEHLEYLNLDSNGLDLTSIPSKTFDRFKNLAVLSIRQDGDLRYRRHDGYEFLSDVKNLESLTISSVGEILYFGVQFNKLEKLAALQVTGGSKKITNLSFENLSQVRVLYLKEFQSLQYFNSSAFWPLINLQHIYMRSVQAHLHQVLDSFQCWVNRSMEYILLEDIWVTLGEQYSSLLPAKGILTPNSTIYLRQICVIHLVLRSCRIIIVHLNALTSDTWDKCLKSIDFTDNAIIGTFSVFFQVMNMRNLEKFFFRDNFKLNSFRRGFLSALSIASDNSRNHSACNTTRINEAQSITLERVFETNNSDCITSNNYFPEANQDPLFTDTSSYEVGKTTTKAQVSESIWYISSKQQFPYKVELIRQANELNIYVSKSMKYLYLSRLFMLFFADFNVSFIGGENVLHVDVSDGGLTEFTGRIRGLTGLRTLLLSSNDLLQLNPQFFDTMPSLQALDLSGCSLNSEYMSSFSERLFLNLQNLQQLDMSYNFLNSLSSRTFSSNPKLFEIRLSGNRFRAIPFDLTNTPRLKWLDLTSNALISISAKDRRELDALAAGNGGLRLFLGGNVLFCGCTSVQFLHWLQMTTVELDMTRNYSCIDNDGVLTNTAVLSDLEAYWRQCWGKMFLSYSLILFCLLIIGFVLSFFVTKYKTYIISGLLNLFSETFLKKPSNYEIGVFIGYADRDYQFACHDLRQFIEDTLGLTTFIRDRDLSPSTDLASGIIDAINRSWRVLLVVNETFLSKDDWFLYTCRSAISNLTPANPNLIVIMVDSQLRHRLPRDILGAVSEENIIVMNEGRRLKYDVTEKLKTRLLA
ncbi:toll-like receptor 4 [Physella acuta]|uniref:toll-like receptor 4 n=1 Tax=Physella acuta TaxID=109671 RepID=UPI0027DC4CF1|nr:toll-like receptor 4 [Physella acuta]